MPDDPASTLDLDAIAAWFANAQSYPDVERYEALAALALDSVPALVARVRALEALVERVVSYTTLLIIEQLDDWPADWYPLQAACEALVPGLREADEA